MTKPKTEAQTRTAQQNKALHVFLRDLSEALNAAGLDMKAVLKPEVDIPWTEESVKNHLWRPIQNIITDTESTTDLETKEVSAIYDVLDRHLGQKLGVHVEFPSEFRMAAERAAG